MYHSRCLNCLLYLSSFQNHACKQHIQAPFKQHKCIAQHHNQTSQGPEASEASIQNICMTSPTWLADARRSRGANVIINVTTWQCVAAPYQSYDKRQLVVDAHRSSYLQLQASTVKFIMPDSAVFSWVWAESLYMPAKAHHIAYHSMSWDFPWYLLATIMTTITTTSTGWPAFVKVILGVSWPIDLARFEHLHAWPVVSPLDARSN